MTQKSSGSDVPIIFADEKARIAWETLQQVRKITETLLPQTPHARALAIKFAPEYEIQGLYAILFPYTVLLKPPRRLL